tara:strand:+ start:533 stop:640 length:108 start_codon:yes stop_codon:yes gene_type:complete
MVADPGVGDGFDLAFDKLAHGLFFMTGGLHHQGVF